VFSDRLAYFRSEKEIRDYGSFGEFFLEAISIFEATSKRLKINNESLWINMKSKTTQLIQAISKIKPIKGTTDWNEWKLSPTQIREIRTLIGKFLLFDKATTLNSFIAFWCWMFRETHEIKRIAEITPSLLAGAYKRISKTSLEEKEIIVLLRTIFFPEYKI
jgi:hypothetical protein